VKEEDPVEESKSVIESQTVDGEAPHEINDVDPQTQIISSNVSAEKR
jgi:hypothetical protein